MANGIGDIELSRGCGNLFGVINEIRAMELPSTVGKGTLWAWLTNNGCDRFVDIRRLFFGEISEGAFCEMYPDHPACYVEIIPPTLGYAWDSWHFEEIPIGSYDIATQTIMNEGDEPLYLWNIYMEWDDDSVSQILSGDEDVTLAAGDSHDIEIIFYGIEAGTWSGYLEMSSNDPDLPQISFGLTGDTL